MRKKLQSKYVVAILLPIIFILGIVYSISSMDLLRADDSASLLTIHKDEEDITGKETRIAENSAEVSLTAAENQLYRLVEKDKVNLSPSGSEADQLPIREVITSQFDLENEIAVLKDESAPADSSHKEDEKKKLTSELIRVTDVETGKVTTYVKLLKKDTKKVSITREVQESTEVTLENVERASKQRIIIFDVPVPPEPEEVEPEVEPEPDKATETPATETEAQDLTGEETLEDLEKRTYSESDSFKPIVLPIEESQKKAQTRAPSSINITGAKLLLRTGTAGFDAKDGNTDPGYDANETNEWVRTFDSNIYLLTFSLEGSDPGITYSDIKYRIDMDLPKAYGFDSNSKLRNNFSIVAENSGHLTTESDGTKTENGYVESSIDSNGQILLPIFVNVYGAQHNTKIQPKIKITIISAVNNKTGSLETFNKSYDENNLPELKAPDTKVSAKANITTTLTKGAQRDFGDTVTGPGLTTSWRDMWQVAGLGVGIKLKELTGRAAGDFRGSTFPVGDIEFELATTKATFNGSNITIGGSESSTTTMFPVRIIAGMYGSTSTTASSWDWLIHKASGRSLKLYSDTLSRKIPYGKGKKIITEEPTDADKTQFGVYDTGTVKLTSDKKVKVSDYEPVWNPYTYDMNGSAASKNDKFFASVSLLVEWSNLYLKSQSSNSKNLLTDIEISKITYEGSTYKADGTTQLAYNTDPGTMSQHIVWSYPNKDGSPGVSLGSQNSVWDARGNAKVNKGYQFDLDVRFSDQIAYENKSAVTYARWNANSAEFDMSRKVKVEAHQSINPVMYGVKKSGVAPNNSKLTAAAIEAEYNWYSTPEAAVATGKKISAVKITKDSWLPQDGYNVMVPVVAGGPIRSYRDSSGNPNIALMNTWIYRKNGTVKFARPGNDYTYFHSEFDTNGIPKQQGTFNTSQPMYHGANTGAAKPSSVNATAQGSIGDTFWINGISITTTTEPEQPIYKTDETVRWKVTGNANGGNVNHTVRLTTTIPKGLEFVKDSGENGLGAKLTPKSVTKNPDGTTTIVWEITGINPQKGDIPEVNFDTTSSLKDLTFSDSSVAEVTVHTEGEIWITSSPSEKDTSKIAMRESTGKVQLYQMQKISLIKEVDPEFLEVGKKDAANPTLSNDVKYKIKLKNNSSDKLVKVKILDALPYNGDSLGTDFTGSYTVTGMKMTKGTATITYTNASIPGIENRDPNTITGWGAYVPGVSSVTSIKNAKAFLVSIEEMEVGEEIEFEIILSPTGQMAGDIYRNRASFNSSIDLPVKSNIVETKVYSRDLTGYVWYDDDYDGLIGTKEDGSPEDPVANIPVKLYRTSVENGSYKKQLVKESLRGNSFIDGSGDSLIKTDSTGKYKFEDLPEGEYLAEFIVGDLVVTKVVIVTKQLVGSDVTKNSKASPTDYKTPEYNQPLLKDLPSALGSGNYVHHVTDVNAGLTRLSTIRLFKYVEGSAIDDGDGHLSEEEIEKTATPLKDAEFDLYEGDSTDPADKIGTAKTDKDGWLEYSGLPPGDYTLVETKAPPGYELIKEPIKVTVPKYNYIVKVYVSDSGETLLPFTGGNKAMQVILVVAGCLMILGMLAVVHQFYPIKIRKRRIR